MLGRLLALALLGFVLFYAAGWALFALDLWLIGRRLRRRRIRRRLGQDQTERDTAGKR